MDARLSGNAEASQFDDTSICGDQTPHAQHSPANSSSSTLDPRLQGLLRLPSVVDLGLCAVPSPAPGGTARPSSQRPRLIPDVTIAVAGSPASRGARSSSAVASYPWPTSRAIRQSVAQARNPLNLRQDEIDKINKVRGGRASLAYIGHHGQAMMQPPLGYAKHDIVRIAANEGGSQALQAVRDLDPALRTLGYAKNDIVSIAAHVGGAQALQKISDLDHALRALGYTIYDIVRIAVHHGGAQALQAVHDLDHALRALGYTQDDIVRIAANHGGSQALRAMRVDLDHALRALGYTQDNIIRIAAHDGGSKALDTVRDLHNAHRRRGYTRDEIVRIAANGGGSKTLRTLHEHHDTLIARGYTVNDIKSLANLHDGASGALKRAAGAG